MYKINKGWFFCFFLFCFWWLSHGARERWFALSPGVGQSSQRHITVSVSLNFRPKSQFSQSFRSHPQSSPTVSGAWLFFFVCSFVKSQRRTATRSERVCVKMNTVFKDCVKIIHPYWSFVLCSRLGKWRGLGWLSPSSSLSGAARPFSPVFFSPVSFLISTCLPHRRHSSVFVDWLIIQHAVAGY